MGRLPWGDTGTMAYPPSLVSSESAGSGLEGMQSPRALPFTTGGFPRTFDRRLHDMLQLAKFELLTQSVGDATRGQYLNCWKKWAQFAARMNQAPCLDTQTPGWGDVPLDFLGCGA